MKSPLGRAFGVGIDSPFGGLGAGGGADTTAPVVNSATYTDETQTLALDFTEANFPCTIYAVVTTSTSPLDQDEISAGSGTGILEADSDTLASGTDTAALDFTDETATVLQFVIVDPSGNKSDVEVVTGITVDSTVPTVSSYSPADGATDVAITADLSIVFSESMDTSASTTVTLKNVGGATIETFDSSTDGTWSTTTNPNDTWTVTPASSFTNGAALAVQYSGFKDEYGNSAAAVADDTTWNFDVVAAVTDIMAGVGDFSSATGWSGVSSGGVLDITGGKLEIDTTANFQSALRTGGNRVSCPENTTLDLLFTFDAITTSNRIRIFLTAYDSGGSALQGQQEVWDTADGDSISTGENSKASAYTSPAGTATLDIKIEFTLFPFVGTMDDFKLVY